MPMRWMVHAMMHAKLTLSVPVSHFSVLSRSYAANICPVNAFPR